jgi:Leucine Rich repeat
MLENFAIYLYFAGIAIAVLGFLWLIVRAFRTHMGWGLGVLFFPPTAFAFIPLRWARARAPFFMLLVGWLAIGAAIGLARFAVSINLGPREKIVDGEQHITLTGWDRTTADYVVLKSKPEVTVLQMANPDVTDQALEYLAGDRRLRELDLNDTQVTDQGLAIVAALPALDVLRLKGTKITDEGFRKELGSKESLRQLDVRNTAVTAESAKLWKDAKKGRRILR